jgi:hypothetical protein
MPIVSPPKPRGKQLEKCLIAALTEAGHTLQEIVLETSNIDALRFAKDEVKDAMLKIFSTPKRLQFQRQIILPVRLGWIGRLDVKFRKRNS